MENIIIIVSLLFSALGIAMGIFYYWQNTQLRILLKSQEEKRKKQQAEMGHKMYELAILKELSERIGYSLNIEKIIDIITGSLNQFIEYSVISYMLLEPERIIFKIHLEKSVSQKFINEIQDRMLKSLSALLDREFKKSQIDESLSGAIIVEELTDPVRSFFNIPLVINNKVVGVLTVAHTKAGLYQEEEMTILYKIVKQASQAISRLQEVIATEQSKLNLMVESMTDGVIMTDKDYRILVANPAARWAVNLPMPGEVTIFNFIENLGNKFDIRGKLEASVRLDKILTTDEVLINDKFYKIFVAPVKSNLPMTEGEILGGVVIFHDITSEKEIETLREDFTSMMIHELRSPLDGIKKISKLMEEDYIRKDKKSYNEFTQLIYKDSAKMLEIVNDLLDVAKLEAGKLEINKEPTDLKKIINERLDYYKIMATDAVLKLDFIYDQNLPMEINLDPQKISQVLNNLIGNSFKYTKTGREIFVQAFIHQKGQELNQEAKSKKLKWFNVPEKYNLTDFPSAVVVAITDTGIGISEKNQTLLFNKFKQFKASALSGEKKGTGLGLVIAKGIIEAHEGRIGAGSIEGQGSTFYFALPIIKI